MKLSLNIYTNEKFLPKNVILGLPEADFPRFVIKNDSITNQILKKIDKGTFLDQRHFIDRFGNKLALSCLSTTAKSLLCIVYNDDSRIVYDIRDIGNNCADILFSLTKGRVFLTKYQIQMMGFTNEYINIDVFVNGKHYRRLEDLIDDYY